MTDFFTVLIFIVLAIVLIGRSQRRQRTRNIDRAKMGASNHIYRSAPPPALGQSGDQGVAETDTDSGYLRTAATSQVADVLSQVLGAATVARGTPAQSTPDPAWDPPAWSPTEPDGPQPPELDAAPDPGAANPTPLSRSAPSGPATSEPAVGTPETVAPVFAELDAADTPKVVIDALRNRDLRAAERALRNASLNGVEGADIALGLLMFRAGRTDEAEGVFRNAARTHGVAANNLGVVLENDGRAREAVTYYQKAAALGSETARQNLQRLEG